jgi:PTS system ascorbate-specific IIA component
MVQIGGDEMAGDEALLTPESLRFQVHARDWEDALRIAAEPLVEAGHIEAGYVQAMIDAVREQGPYIVIAPGLALGHARPSADVHRACFAIATLDEPVEFGSAANDPVDIVVVLAAIDDKAHLGLLRRIVVFLNAEGSFERLRAARTRQDAQAIVDDIVGA